MRGSPQNPVGPPPNPVGPPPHANRYTILDDDLGPPADTETRSETPSEDDRSTMPSDDDRSATIPEDNRSVPPAHDRSTAPSDDNRSDYDEPHPDNRSGDDPPSEDDRNVTFDDDDDDVTVDYNDPIDDRNTEVTGALEGTDATGSTESVEPTGTQTAEMPPGQLRREFIKLSDTLGYVEPVLESRTRSGTQHGTTFVQAHRRLKEHEDRMDPLVIAPNEWATEYEQAFPGLFHYCMTQYPMTKGLKLFGDEGVQAVRKEVQQLHDVNALQPLHPKDLSVKQRSRVLEYLMFLKQKRTGLIKGRGCADGRPQRLWTSKEDSRSPTAHLESVIFTAVIEAFERRYVITLDIPGAFLQTLQDDEVHVRLRGQMAILLVEICRSKYARFLTYDRGKPVIYAKLNKALYGTLRAAILFWEKLSAAITSWGFDINPYDSCVANKMIKGSQCTIVWHVDDLKISHVDPQVLEEIVQTIKKEFGTGSELGYPLTVNRGKIHDYLGMVLDYSNPGKVIIDMKQYIKNTLDSLPPDMSGTAKTPATPNLFKIPPSSNKLDQSVADFFHTYVAKLLFLCMRGRPDIQTAISFLCTRVSAPTEDDFNKLWRVLQYLRGTIDIVLTLEATDLQIFKWWIDGSYSVHHDMRGHTGLSGTMGKGSFSSMSNKQRINTKSSTECEVVGVDDGMGRILWSRYFMNAQGYTPKESIIYQDNQSAILLENNGMASSSKRTKHINVRYFFITDRIKAREVKVEYCPTTEMIADFFTKPLQGRLFYKFRAVVMNLPDEPDM